MRVAWVVALLAGGCGFQVASSGTGIDASPLDAEGTGPCPWPYVVPNFEPCGAGSLTYGDLDLMVAGSYLYNTDTDVLVDPIGETITVSSTSDATARVIWTHRFRIANGSTLRIIGNLPVILVSQSSITVEGIIDVSSRAAGSNKVGAGSNPPACDLTRAQPGVQCDEGGSGGGGGAFGGNGGPGGPGAVGKSCSAGTGVLGGAGGMATNDTSFRAGCDGGDGADGSDGGGEAGDGGGAIHLIARDQLVLGATGQVLAGGAGGEGASGGRSGGGGGGSGGLIMVSGTTLLLQGVLAANGGGGGGASNMQNAQDGQDGQPSILAAAGGVPENNQGPGGIGGTSGNGAVGIGLDRGGGGGGGGTGKIRLTVKAGTPTLSGATISPAPAPP